MSSLFCFLTLLLIAHQASTLKVEKAFLVYYVNANQQYVVNNFELINDHNETNTNCFSSIQIHLKIETTYVTAFLYRFGGISTKQVESLECRRTKLFHINETHVILQIDRNIMIVGTWEINEKITNYLYHNDFPKYILEQVQIYREINATYNMFIALTVILAIPTIFSILKIFFDLIYFICFIRYYLNKIFRQTKKCECTRIKKSI